MKKVILDAKTDKDVDEISKMRVRVAIPDDHDDGEFTTVEVPLLSHDVRAMINNIIFVACYGHKKMFEARVPLDTSVAFRSTSLACAKEQESNFYRLWKEYLARSGRSEEGAAAEQERVDRMQGMMGGNSDDDEPAGGGAAAEGAAEAAQAARPPSPLVNLETLPTASRGS